MKLFFLLISFIFFTSCSNNETQKLKIVTNSWIGYTPLFYAKEKNYLSPLNIEIISTVSLSASTDIFNIAKADIITATQHEYNSLKKSFTTLVPIILIDRSYGGDMILSNRSISELQKSKEIVVYLEIDSINREMIQDFITKYKLNNIKITYIDKDQAKLQNVHYNFEKENIVIVTYIPYNSDLEEMGFKKVATTKDLKTLLVIDALYTTTNTFEMNKKRLMKLKSIIDKSIEEIELHPKEAYALTHKYLGNISYEEFLNSLKMIKWVNHPSPALLQKIRAINLESRYIIQ